MTSTVKTKDALKGVRRVCRYPIHSKQGRLGDDQGAGDLREGRGDGCLWRGAYYQHKRVLDNGGTFPASGGTRRTRRRETTSETAVESAVATLRRAIESIDTEIEVAKERAREAQAEYEAMKASASERKAAIEEKITLLEQTA